MDFTGEQASGRSHISKTAGDAAPSRGGSNHDEVCKYLAVDHVVFTKVLTVMDLVSRRHQSSSESGRHEEPDTEIADGEPPLRRRSSSRGPSQTLEDLGKS